MKYTEGMLRDEALKGKTIGDRGRCWIEPCNEPILFYAGANLVITSRKLDVLEETAKEMSAASGNPVLPLACDVREYE